ncbi:MAG TPA: MaoC family dehydratase [Capillimicrobium sp.]|nr:MaoC family dehydratase [Capillimicrobium sp.]
MSALTADPQPLAVGAELSGPEIVVNADRLAAYGDGLLSSAAGRAVQVGSNIHTDVELARSQGLPAPIADGMLSTNYLSSMLTRAFGRFYIENGELRTKFIKPVPVDTLLRVRGRVRAREELGDGRVRYELDVWTENGNGVKVVDGDAAVEVTE